MEAAIIGSGCNADTLVSYNVYTLTYQTEDPHREQK